MKRYCFDTSGLSNPLEFMPEDIHPTIWARIRAFLEEGGVAVTSEIYDEMTRLPGSVGDCIRRNRDLLLMEVGVGAWNWNQYTAASSSMLTLHREFIAEYNGGGARTVGVNDISIIALAKTLNLPLVSMEKSATASPTPSQKKRRIPDICQLEGVTHLDFNDFLRAEGIQI